MALVVDNPLTGDATHALVIGVGSYPNKGWGLGELHGAPDSALGVVDWLRNEFPAQGAPPLATVDLLLSPTALSAPCPYPGVERAGIANLDAAIGRWFARCNARESNLALFYFCGHGVEKGLKSSLLADDFGAHPLNLMEEAISVDDFTIGMDNCAAVNQCFILDACRNMPPQFVKLTGFGKAIIAPDIDGRQTPTPRNYAIIYGTSSQSNAYGAPQGSVSQFTAALLKALRGAAWDDMSNPWNEWTLRVELMVPAINNLLKLQERHENGMPQQARLGGGSGGMLLMRTQKPPRVPVVVICDPEARTHEAALQVQRNGSVLEQRAPGVAAPWLISLPADASPYAVRATLNAAATSEDLTVRPPFREKTIRVPP